ncbi:hypothetical protein FACS189472_11750 [Alphaproteobacteria bacterium]|nr:hypothetical protein FACS189472_11750 [Alphaproteobacteria bacterium]
MNNKLECNVASIIEKCEISNTRDVRRIIAHIKEASYEDIFFNGDAMFLTQKEYDLFLNMISRYKNQEPISKIINKKSFWKHDFFVNEDVLDPRPETELIIETVLQHFDTNDELKIMDLGTGSGCILLSLLQEFKRSIGIGIDISHKAIDVAIHNRRLLNVDRATFITADWTVALQAFTFAETASSLQIQSAYHSEGSGSINWSSVTLADLIVSNPPYIRSDDIPSLDENVRKYDPMVALDGGNSGLNAYVKIAAISRHLLKKNGMIFLEVGYDQADDIVSILKTNGYGSISKAKDINGIDRVVYATS